MPTGRTLSDPHGRLLQLHRIGQEIILVRCIGGSNGFARSNGFTLRRPFEYRYVGGNDFSFQKSLLILFRFSGSLRSSGGEALHERFEQRRLHAIVFGNFSMSSNMRHQFDRSRSGYECELSRAIGVVRSDVAE